MKAKLYRFFIELTNGAFTSTAIKKFACSRMSKPFIPSYASVYKINQDEMKKDIHLYPNLHAFFTRELKEGTRTVNTSPNTVVSPVDGVVEDAGMITPEKEIIVKGKPYSISEMLGSSLMAEKYAEGTYIIIYLSPSHYHRIHSPINGKVIRSFSIGKKSFPVNRLGLKYGKSVLAKNYRVVTEIESDRKNLALVKVGAMLINSVVVTNNKLEWKKGEEAAYFSFGSTVILLFEKEAFLSELSFPMEIKMGDVLGRLTSK